jgi:hypothetical protein
MGDPSENFEFMHYTANAVDLPNTEHLIRRVHIDRTVKLLTHERYKSTHWTTPLFRFVKQFEDIIRILYEDGVLAASS